MKPKSDKPTKHLIILLIVTIVLIFSVATMLYVESKQVDTFSSDATSFENCVERGNAVMESYPRQCRDEAGNSFTEDIGNELLMMDSIRSNSPRPGALISSPLKISGEAVGFWFFEGDFAIKLVDDNGAEVGFSVASAKGEWMTEDFVEFESIMTFGKSTTKTGKLIFNKDNPSGLAENDAELVVPVRFE